MQEWPCHTRDERVPQYSPDAFRQGAVGIEVVLGATVQVQDGWAERPAAGSRQHHPVHLGRQPDGANLVLGPVQQLDERLDRRPYRGPPLFGIRLGPPRTRAGHPYGRRSSCQLVTGVVEEDRLDRPRAQVDPEGTATFARRLAHSSPLLSRHHEMLRYSARKLRVPAEPKGFVSKEVVP